MYSITSSFIVLQVNVLGKSVSALQWQVLSSDVRLLTLTIGGFCIADVMVAWGLNLHVLAFPDC